MSIQFVDRCCTVDVHPTPRGYSFEYGGKTHKRRTEAGVHNFFLKECLSNKLDTVKLRINNEKYYLHFSLDETEKFSSKKALRAILAQESNGAWIEEKNGIRRYFMKDGWLFSRAQEVSSEEFTAHEPSSLMNKISKFALGVFSSAPQVAWAASVFSCHSPGVVFLGFSLLQASPALAQMPAYGEFRVNTNTTYNQLYPTLTSLTDGGFVAAWAGVQTGNFDIYSQRYDANGAPVINQSLPAPTPSPALLTGSPVTSSPSPSLSTATGISSAQTPLPIPSSQSSTIYSQVSPSPSQTSLILSVTEISYGNSYPITVNGVSVGTFEFTGGTGLVNGGSTNTLTIHLDPDADLGQGTVTLFTIPAGQEGQFQSIELVGESCQSLEGSTATDGSGQTTYQVIYQQDTCASAARPVSAFFPTTMLKV